MLPLNCVTCEKNNVRSQSDVNLRDTCPEIYCSCPPKQNLKECQELLLEIKDLLNKAEAKLGE